MSSFCPACGNAVEAGDQFCRVCGRQMAVPTAPSLSPPVAVGPAQNSGKAIASLVFGLFLFFFPFSLVAVILGHLSLSEIRKSAGRLQGHGMAIAGLVLGYIGIAFIPLILIIAAIAIPNVLRARIAANESSAVASVRTLMTAETVYAAAHPDEGYTCSLADLARQANISGPLADGKRSGYIFALSGCTADPGSAANAHFQIAAYPENVNTSGIRAFCSDETNVIKADSGGSAQRCLETGTTLQ